MTVYVAVPLTRTERRILKALADGEWHYEIDLHASFRVLQNLHLRGLVDGAMDTTGFAPSDRVWRRLKS